MLAKDIGQRQLVRLGGAAIAVGVAVDVPPHLFENPALDTVAVVGHVLVLSGMVAVLIGILLVAVGPTASTSDHRPKEAT